MTGVSHQKGFGWPHVFFAPALVVILAGISIPLLLRGSCGGDARTEALNNAKAIASGLSSFKEEYGTSPCAETREILYNNNDDSLFGDQVPVVKYPLGF